MHDAFCGQACDEPLSNPMLMQANDLSDLQKTTCSLHLLSCPNLQLLSKLNAAYQNGC